MNELLKLTEVAERLGVSEKTARRYVKSGVLPSAFVGNSYRVTDSDIQEFLRASRVKPGGGRPKAARRSSDLEPSLNDVLEEEERRVIAEDYLNARKAAQRLLHVHRQRIDRQAHRWEVEADSLTPQEVRSTLYELEGLVKSGVFEIAHVPKSRATGDLVDTSALDEADSFEVEMIRKAVSRMRLVAEKVIGRAQVDALLADVESRTPEIRAEIEAHTLDEAS